MDSCNSGSLQSSSGGEDDYGSRAATESISTFLNPTPQPPPPSMFDPLLNFITPNLETAWSKALTSGPGPGPGPMAQHLVASSLTALPPVTMSRSTTEQVDRTPHLGPRNPKKRSRASRRAPTTVLTTDPTNFRAMVQEFTGIPTPPFASSSPFVKSRLDLFGAPSSTRSQPVDASSSQPLPYLLRPFAQKFQPHPPLDPIGSSSSSNSNSNDYQMQNQSLTFQSLLSKSAIPLHEFGFGQTQPSGLPNLVTSDGTAWPFGVGPIDGDRSQRQLGLVNGDYGYARSTGTSDKLVNYSASSSDYHGEKGSGNVPSRGEGMVESWICSSDL